MSMTPFPPRPAPLGAVPVTDLLLILIISLLAQKFLPFLFFGLVAVDPVTGESEPGARLFAGLLFLVAHSLVLLAAIHRLILRKHGLHLSDLGIVLGTRQWVVRAAVLGVVAVPAINFINVLTQGLLRTQIDNPQLEAFAGAGFSWPGYLGTLLVAGAIVPVVEEIAFRGLLYGWLRTRTGLTAAVVISSLCFAVLHGVPHLIPAFAAIGALFAIIAERSGSVLVAAVLHGVFNAVNLSLLYLSMLYGAGP